MLNQHNLGNFCHDNCFSYSDPPSRSWKLRWFVLESTQLSYYEKFDSTGGKPIDVKGEMGFSGCGRL